MLQSILLLQTSKLPPVVTKMITSRQNSKIKHISQLSSQGKARKKEGLYVVEGIRILEEAHKAGRYPNQVLYTSELDQRGWGLLKVFQDRNIPCEEAAPEVFKAASDTETPQGILAVFPIDPAPVPEKLNLVLIADKIRDPGNLGTLVRSCLAAEADLLILSPGSVDPYSPKVIRAGMGAHFRLPVIKTDYAEISRITAGLTLFLADMNEGKSLWETDLGGRVGLIIGSEAHGPGKSARGLASNTIHIPMNPASESLNAAVSGAVLLFEVLRQRNLLNK